jgi:hypothetical protein
VRDYRKAEADFDYFATDAPAIIGNTFKDIPRAQALERANGFLVERTSPLSLQAWFGKRPTGRQLIGAAGIDVEVGAHLVYSLGATGLAAAILYPAKSETASVQEEHLILGFWKPENLADQIEAHLKTLVAYQYVTSIDGEPTRGERLKVWWLRMVCLRKVDGEHSVAAKVAFRWLAGMATRGLFVALFRVGLLFALVLLLLWLGYDWLAALFARRS